MECPNCAGPLLEWCREGIYPGSTQLPMWTCEACRIDFAMVAEGDEEPHLCGVSIVD